MMSLHVDLFAGLPGKLFLGFMGLLLPIANVSGVVLCAPFTLVDAVTGQVTDSRVLPWYLTAC